MNSGKELNALNHPLSTCKFSIFDEIIEASLETVYIVSHNFLYVIFFQET